MPTRTPLLTATPRGLYCQRGDFFIDPSRPVQRAVVTHAHADHARAGSARYLATTAGGPILKHRLGSQIDLRTLDYGEPLHLNGVKLSFHPAGHILGSAQVRLEHGGAVWAVSGDYKNDADATCDGFEPIACHTFVTESTFALPVFRWPAQQAVLAQINAWWRSNRDRGAVSVLFAYALGKAQRVIAGLDPAIGPIFAHGAVAAINDCYRRQGIRLPDTRPVGRVDDPRRFAGAMVIAPPSARTGAWLRRFKRPSLAFASGWMQIRGHRRRRGVDRGFVLSDHCDWPGIHQAILAAGAESVWVTHGYAAELVRWLAENGREARAVQATSQGGRSDADAR